MTKAVKDFVPGSGPLTRKKDGPGTYSASSVWGDATLATREKGEKLTEHLVASILAELEAVRTATVAP